MDSLKDIPGAPGEPTVKQAEVISDVPSSAGEGPFFPAVSFPLSETELGPRITSSCPTMRQDTQTLKGRNLLYPCKPQATREVPEVVQDMCGELEALMEQFRATGQRLPSSFQRLVGHSFGQLK